MKKLYFILAAIILAFNVNAQLTVKLNINHKLLSQNFAFNQATTNNLGHSFNLNRMQYYMSSFVIIHDGAQTTTATGVYNLVDASTITSINLGTYTNVTNIEGIKFSVGVNTPENNQDPTLWPSNHALSPKSPSMHWGWASGYFFIALGGNSSPSLNQQLELHALGNSNYYSQTITTGATQSAGELIITINADYAQALKNINISSGLVLHGSSGANATMANNFRDFVFSANISVGIDENTLSEKGLMVFPNPSSTGVFSINTGNYSKSATALKITDVTGRTLQIKKLNELNNNEISIDTKGIYFVSLLSNEEVITTQKVIVY